MSKQKVLIILYYWPPAGGPGVQRWLKFVKYLPEFDIEPIVYCPENPNYPIVDKSLINEVPKGITIIKQPIKEPYSFARFFSRSSTKNISAGVIPKLKTQSLIQKIMLFVRGNFFIPDARKNWIKPSVSFLTNYIDKNNINTVITTGPPHSLHLIGFQLKEKADVNWITDFRDPWTTIGYHKSLKLTKTSKKKHEVLENQVLRNTDKIVVTSNHTKNEFALKTDKPITVITNGYDSHSVEIKEKDKLFTLSHIGSLLSDRNPELLWEVLSELKNEDSNFSERFQLNLVGVVSDDVLQSIYQYGLKENTNVVGYVSHDEAVRFQLKSQLLLLIEIDSEDTKAIIPGKVFEYMSSETPIIAIGPQDSDVSKIIIETNTGTYYHYKQKKALKSALLNYFNTYQNGILKTTPIGLQNYSRKNLSKQLADIIKY